MNLQNIMEEKRSKTPRCVPHGVHLFYLFLLYEEAKYIPLSTPRSGLYFFGKKLNYFSMSAHG